MAGKKNTRTMRKNMDISDMDFDGLVNAVKEAAAKAPDQEAAKSMKKQMGKMILTKLEEMEAVCEAEYERELAMLREMRRNLPSAVATLTIGQIRDAGGYYGPDKDGHVTFKIPSHLYRMTASEPTKTEKTVVASAQKIIDSHNSHRSKRMSKRTRTVNPNTPGSMVKTKVPKLMDKTGTPVMTGTRQSARIRRTKPATSSTNSSLLMSSTEEQGFKGSQTMMNMNKPARETEFQDALDGFASGASQSADATAKKTARKKTSKRKEEGGESELPATGAASANLTMNTMTTTAEVHDVQVKLHDMSIANPRTPQGQHRLLPKPVRLAKDDEAVVTIHVSKDGTPLLLKK